MRRIGLVLLLALGACQQPAQPAANTPAPARAGATPVNPDPQVRTYACTDGQTVQAGYPDRDTAVVDVGGHAYTLKSERAASGVRYVGFGLQWWTKGLTEARLSRLRDGETIASEPGVLCRAGAEVPVQPPSPGAPGGLPDDRRPLAEGSIDPAGPQGAGDVAQRYFALLESGRAEPAWALWSSGSPERPANAAALAAERAKFVEYHAQVGAPGEPEGAAGSLFVTIPVVIYGRTTSGAEVHRSGHATLRRVNDVPGSTPEQRQWRLYQIELRP